jgi:hypothetical protein
MHWLLPFLYMEAKFGPLDKKDEKRLTSVEMKFFRTAGNTLFEYKRNEGILEELKLEPVEEKLRRYI